MFTIIKTISFCLFLSTYLTIFAQKSNSFYLNSGIDFYVSNNNITPYWLRNNQYGKVPLKNPTTVIDLRMGNVYKLRNTKYILKYEIELTKQFGQENNFWITQGYLGLKNKLFDLYFGRRREIFGLGDTLLTSGFYAWSGNAVPIPKIQIGSNGFINIFKGKIGLFFNYAHGWRDNQMYIKNGFLHQKSIYFRLGKPHNKFNLFYGINHQVYWGGQRFDDNNNLNATYGSGLASYFYVVTGIKSKNLVNPDENSNPDELGNQFGNHLGSIDILASYKSKIGEISIYRQFAYETGRILNLTTANDGISGISIKMGANKIIEKFNIEYIYTFNQGYFDSGISKFLNLKDTHEGERESYFNHSYGPWQYWGKGIGTPIIIYNPDSGNGNDIFFYKNAIKAISINTIGYLKNIKLRYLIKFSHGTYYTPSKYMTYDEPTDPEKQFSIGINLEKTLNKEIKLNLGIGLDSGKMLKETIGGKLGLRYFLR
ncbi:hypothetical protein EOJ36_04005 [Sandaracinomonas limnophila]|uniref:Capsule assembly protein Wzi n=1 Tax=Sandaracinomonas limnophila TaxID=1862386 RepID=A0A437PTN6_9BACT|nr:capsule assembly Wzi family protein [Sandaracinomonas limnophila]RVU25590.1 hypothetical protein EOJ36_04005 [Sandaracinomonas limnophila]